MKKIPYGIFDYKTLKEENYIYIDKTMYLEKLENLSDKTLMYLRPGRFGKSLFTSMMYYYYDINSKDIFDNIFKDTYVYNNPTPNKNNYYILKFDFSSLDTSTNEIEKSFIIKIMAGIQKFQNTYGFKFNEDITGLHPNEIIIKFLSFFDSLNLKNKICILIDEYDNFTNGILEGDTSLFKSVVSENGFLKNFYSAIKQYVGEGIVDRFFATGICPITLNSMTTGFNICTDISTDIRFNSMVGLTHVEVKNLLKELNLNDEEQNNIYKLMIENYDGYLFSKKLKEENRVFNATLVMYLLKNYQDFNSIPEELYDNNIVVNYGKIDNLIKLQNNTFYKELISEILATGETSGTLKTQFNLLEEFSREDIISLLYYFGYLTIKEETIGSRIVFRIPNEIMKQTYNNYFIKLLNDINITIDRDKIDTGVIEIINTGKIDTITNYVSEIIKQMDNRILIDFNEKDIEIIYYTLLKEYKEISFYNEYPCNGGYADIFIKSNNNILIELKYIKKKDYKEQILENKKQEGINQLNEYSKDSRINYNLKKYIVIFVGDEVKLIEEI